MYVVLFIYIYIYIIFEPVNRYYSPLNQKKKKKTNSYQDDVTWFFLITFWPGR